MTPTERPSISTNLEARYKNQATGGAYDAKTIGKWGSHAPIENSLQSQFWTPGGFKVFKTATEFNNVGGSIYLKGHATNKYIGNPPSR